jgi:hypothetical protein
MQQLMRTARTQDLEWREVLWGNVGMGTNEDESSTGCIWAVGFHHVTACSGLAGALKPMTRSGL